MRRLPSLLLALTALAVLLLLANPARAQVDENSLKAAYIYRFAQFVSWPEQQLPDSEPLRFCMLGNQPLGERFISLASSRQVGVHPIDVAIDGAVDGCHVIYLGRESDLDLLGQLQGQPVLTVGESSDFILRGGVIQLYHDGNRIAFEIDHQQGRSSGLTISSELLRLGRRR